MPVFSYLGLNRAAQSLRYRAQGNRINFVEQ